MSVVRAVPMGHKVATRAIPKGAAVVKFGQIIGYATDDIAPGAHVHVHNCAMGEHDQNYQIGVDYKPVQLPRSDGRDLQGPPPRATGASARATSSRSARR